MRLILNSITCLLLVFLQTGYITAQEAQEDLYDHELSEEKWKNLRDGIRYERGQGSDGSRWTYESDEEWQRDRNKRGSGNGSGSGSGQGNGSGSGDGSSSEGGDGASIPVERYEPPPSSSNMNVSFGGIGALGYILIVIFAIGLAILIYYMFLNASKGKGTKIQGKVVILDDISPVEISLTELQRLLQEALARGDYRGAVRIYFIFILRDLATKHWIEWEKEKTNFQYLREMSGRGEYDDFNRSVSFFEYIWYGERELDAPTFEQIRPNFTKLLDKLGVR